MTSSSESSASSASSADDGLARPISFDSALRRRHASRRGARWWRCGVRRLAHRLPRRARPTRRAHARRRSHRGNVGRLGARHRDRTQPVGALRAPREAHRGPTKHDLQVGARGIVVAQPAAPRRSSSRVPPTRSQPRSPPSAPRRSPHRRRASSASRRASSSWCRPGAGRAINWWSLRPMLSPENGSRSHARQECRCSARWRRVHRSLACSRPNRCSIDGPWTVGCREVGSTPTSWPVHSARWCCRSWEHSSSRGSRSLPMPPTAKLPRSAPRAPKWRFATAGSPRPSTSWTRPKCLPAVALGTAQAVEDVDELRDFWLA